MKSHYHVGMLCNNNGRSSGPEEVVLRVMEMRRIVDGMVIAKEVV